MTRTCKKLPRPVSGTCRCIKRPIYPCKKLPDGMPGQIGINGTDYVCSALAYLPEKGEPMILGYRLTKADGTSYDLDLTWTFPTCDCPDFTYRREGIDPKGCKHLAAINALRAAGKLV